jgi:hypothetical protein
VELSSLALLWIGLISCSIGDPNWCADRDDDADCDGVPDAMDQCANSAADQPTDRSGCTATQAEGCGVRALAPLDGEKRLDDMVFRWETDCDVTLLQFSDDPDFPAGATTTIAKTTATEIAAQPAGEWWRLQSGLNGSSGGAVTPPRSLQ